MKAAKLVHEVTGRVGQLVDHVPHDGVQLRFLTVRQSIIHHWLDWDSVKTVELSSGGGQVFE